MFAFDSKCLFKIGLIIISTFLLYSSNVLILCSDFGDDYVESAIEVGESIGSDLGSYTCANMTELEAPGSINFVSRPTNFFYSDVDYSNMTSLAMSRLQGNGRTNLYWINLDLDNLTLGMEPDTNFITDPTFVGTEGDWSGNGKFIIQGSNQYQNIPDNPNFYVIQVNTSSSSLSSSSEKVIESMSILSATNVSYGVDISKVLFHPRWKDVSYPSLVNYSSSEWKWEEGGGSLDSGVGFIERAFGVSRDIGIFVLDLRDLMNPKVSVSSGPNGEFDSRTLYCERAMNQQDIEARYGSHGGTSESNSNEEMRNGGLFGFSEWDVRCWCFSRDPQFLYQYLYLALSNQLVLEAKLQVRTPENRKTQINTLNVDTFIKLPNKNIIIAIYKDASNFAAFAIHQSYPIQSQLPQWSLSNLYQILLPTTIDPLPYQINAHQGTLHTHYPTINHPNTQTINLFYSATKYLLLKTCVILYRPNPEDNLPTSWDGYAMRFAWNPYGDHGMFPLAPSYLNISEVDQLEDNIAPLINPFVSESDPYRLPFTLISLLNEGIFFFTTHFCGDSNTVIVPSNYGEQCVNGTCCNEVCHFIGADPVIECIQPSDPCKQSAVCPGGTNICPITEQTNKPVGSECQSEFYDGVGAEYQQLPHDENYKPAVVPDCYSAVCMNTTTDSEDLSCTLLSYNPKNLSSDICPDLPNYQHEIPSTNKKPDQIEYPPALPDTTISSIIVPAVVGVCVIALILPMLFPLGA